MKAKTIKAVLTKKHSDFVNSIKCERVKKLVEKNSIITGGSIVNMLLDEKVNDFDYYFTDRETVIAVAEYYVEQFKQKRPDVNASVEVDGDRVKVYIPSDGMVGESEPGVIDTLDGEPVENEQAEQATEQNKEPYRPVFLSSNAITLSDKVQLVIRFYGKPEVIHENYDFVHCTCWWRSSDGFLALPQQALEAILTKELIYQGSKYPLCSIFRTRKFIERGWSINAGQYLKMALQLNELDLTDIDVLEEQLTGVDALYFQQVINQLRQRKTEDPGFKVTTPYLIEVINRIF